MATDAIDPATRELAQAGVEINGINVIPEEERHGRPHQLFWPWFGSNVSILGLGYGAFALYQGVSFWQALVAGVLGIVASFVLCGLVAVAGKRGSAPTLVLSRAPFGVNGNRRPHRRLRHRRGGRDPLEHGVGHPVRVRAALPRHARPVHDRLRPRLGQRGR
jgi:hypothetical protein